MEAPAYVRTARYAPERVGSYGGVDALRRVVPEQDVERWLSKQDAYTLHKPVRRHFNRRCVEVFFFFVEVFFFFRVLHTMFSHLRAHAFARSVTVARSSAVQASSRRRQERRWAIVCGPSQSQSTDWASSR